MIIIKKELDNFTIESDTNIDYLDDIVSCIIDNEKRIFDFFRLDKLPTKSKILIISYEPFKEFIISIYGEIQDYMAGYADARSNTIRALNIEDQKKYTSHKNANVEKMQKKILHEIVHQCHHTYNFNYRGTTWFAEGLATNLSYQDRELEDLNECDFDTLKNDFRHYKGNYSLSYTIVKYILNNYSEEEIYKLYSNVDYLREKADTIFEEAKTWVNEQRRKHIKG